MLVPGVSPADYDDFVRHLDLAQEHAAIGHGPYFLVVVAPTTVDA